MSQNNIINLVLHRDVGVDIDIDLDGDIPLVLFLWGALTNTAMEDQGLWVGWDQIMQHSETHEYLGLMVRKICRGET